MHRPFRLKVRESRTPPVKTTFCLNAAKEIDRRRSKDIMRTILHAAGADSYFGHWPRIFGPGSGIDSPSIAQNETRTRVLIHSIRATLLASWLMEEARP
jgi:hypothetical protein